MYALRAMPYPTAGFDGSVRITREMGEGTGALCIEFSDYALSLYTYEYFADGAGSDGSTQDCIKMNVDSEYRIEGDPQDWLRTFRQWLQESEYIFAISDDATEALGWEHTAIERQQHGCIMPKIIFCRYINRYTMTEPTNFTPDNAVLLGFERKLWDAADRMRGHMDPSEYKHIALGLIFLKYISDVFSGEVTTDLEARAATEYTEPEDRDEYAAENIFWVPPAARWNALQNAAHTPEIGRLLDDRHARHRTRKPLLERRSAQRVRPSRPRQTAAGRDYRPLLQHPHDTGAGTDRRTHWDASTSISSAVFAGAEGKRGGEFYTPPSVVRLLVQMIEPYKGRVYDPCCGSSGMFVQSERFIEEHGGRIKDLSIYGQESNNTTWRLAKMNLAIRGIDANLGDRNADTFLSDLHPDLKAGLRPRQSALQYVLLGATPISGRCALEVRHAARQQRQTMRGCSTSSTTSRPSVSQASFSRTAP